MREIWKRGITFGVSALIALTLFSGCEKEEVKEEKNIEAENLLERVDTKESDKEITLPTTFIEANTNFSIDLFKNLASEENALFSPIPIYSSLALIANGAEDKAADEIMDALNVKDLNNEEINNYYHELMKSLESEKESVELNLSNSIWYDNDFKANEAYLEKNKTYYNTDSFRIDFADKDTPDLMNDWVNNQSNEKIEEIVDEIDCEALMYLFSTIYFDAKWATPFKASDSYPGEFYLGDETVEIEKMTGRFDLERISTADEEGVILPYKGKQYSFFALMPNEETEIREYIDRLNQEKMNEMSQAIEKEEIELHLPKFEVSNEEILNDSLKEMGILKIFDSDSNPLNKMGSTEGNLFVNNIFQKSYLTVDEEGTEAGSAVASEIETTSLPMKLKAIDFNRPFLYGIIDEKNHLPVFLGIMDRPDK